MNFLLFVSFEYLMESITLSFFKGHEKNLLNTFFVVHYKHKVYLNLLIYISFQIERVLAFYDNSQKFYFYLKFFLMLL